MYILNDIICIYIVSYMHRAVKNMYVFVSLDIVSINMLNIHLYNIYLSVSTKHSVNVCPYIHISYEHI
jgi:hypothetical protein